jgi:hypothetical protein
METQDCVHVHGCGDRIRSRLDPRPVRMR